MNSLVFEGASFHNVRFLENANMYALSIIDPPQFSRIHFGGVKCREMRNVNANSINFSQHKISTYKFVNLHSTGGANSLLLESVENERHFFADPAVENDKRELTQYEFDNVSFKAGNQTF